MDVTEKDVGKAITGMVRAFEAEYAAMSEADLLGRWFFKYQPEKSLAWNMWHFYDKLALFAGSCRRWEEMHNGSACVVERVRDKYVIPRIQEFEAIVRERVASETP